MKFEKRDYSDSESLDRLAHRLTDVLPELSEAANSQFKAFFSSTEPEHLGGKCRKLDGAVRHQTKLDYFVLIHKDPFIESDSLHRLRMLAHELNHIAMDRTSWVIRRHAGDFCEIAEHDKTSYRLALKAMAALGLKYDKPEEARKYAGITQNSTP